jgi:hypothetical protein
MDKADRVIARVHSDCLLPLPALETDVGASNNAHNSIQTRAPHGTATPRWPHPSPLKATPPPLPDPPPLIAHIFLEIVLGISSGQSGGRAF